MSWPTLSHSPEQRRGGITIATSSSIISSNTFTNRNIKNAGVDLAPLYPDSLRPAFITDLRQFYITTFRDQFFISPPAWFAMYTWMEALYHLPLSVYAIGALLRGKLRESFVAVSFFSSCPPRRVDQG